MKTEVTSVIPTMGNPEIAIGVIRGFIRENLELGWSNLEDGRIDLAEHHFRRALEQLAEIRAIITQSADQNQTPLLPL